MNAKTPALDRWSQLGVHALLALAIWAVSYVLNSLMEHRALNWDRGLAIQAFFTAVVTVLLMRWFDAFNFGPSNEPTSSRRSWFRN